MFQNFESASQRVSAKSRIEALRAEMKRIGIDAFLVPHADEHQNEYLPASAERLAWLTGFTGSAGFAIVTADKAVLFVDGRYTLQAAEQTDTTIFSIDNLIDHPPAKWLAESGADGMRCGFDPWLTTIAQHRRFAKALAPAGAELVAVANPIDALWADRPAAPSRLVELHPLLHAGKSASEKLAEIAAEIAKAGADWHVVTDLASLAWLFNLRGGDIAHIPLAIGFALVPATDKGLGKPLLFLDAGKIGSDVRAALSELAELLDPASLLAAIGERAKGARFLCDPEGVAQAIAIAIAKAGGTLVEGRDPCALPRAVKNEAEIAGSRAAHLRDGVAMVRFLAWLDRQQPGSLDEIGAATKLEQCRAETAGHMNSELREISFDTISGAGPDGAIVHYRVSRATNRKLENDTLYLVDSGGQYVDGTTDITRTVAIGTPPTAQSPISRWC